MNDPQREHIHARTPVPLNTDEMARCVNIGEDLRSGLAQALQSLGATAGSVRDMADALSVDRNICQRVAAAAKTEGEARDVLARAPGVRGLRMFIRACVKGGAGRQEVSAALSAIDALDRLIREVAGSQTKLINRLRASRRDVFQTIPDDEAAAARAKRFEADVQLLGISADVLSAVDIYRPIPDQSGGDARFEALQAFAWSQVAVHHLGLPFLHRSFTLPDKDTEMRTFNLDYEEVPELSNGHLIPDFTSHPLPETISRGGPEESLTVYDLDLVPGEEPKDLCTARLLSPAGILPSLTDDPMIQRRLTPRYPVRKLIIDTFLHRSMVKGCVPTLGTFIRNSTAVQGANRTLDRLPNSPRLQLVEPTASGVSSSLWPRQEELLNHIFTKLDWDMGEFIGYRCEVDFPMISFDYITKFDFEPTR